MPGHLAFFGVFMSFHLMMILALGPTPGGGFFLPASSASCSAEPGAPASAWS